MNSSSQTPLLCSLIFDEMSIRKHVQWNGKENIGFVDLGTGIDDDSMPVATEVLMFIVVPLNAAWKLPVAYFLIDGLAADVKSNLVLEAINRLHAVNVRIVALVCDGPTTNFAVGSKLGASFTVDNMKSYFIHPANHFWKVHIIFDAAHMLKLMRNILAEKGILTDQNNKQIRWQHIKDLYALQDREGLKAANKLKRSHIEWYQQKMKVSLAAQCMSRSVANALEFLGQDLGLPQFADVAPTVAFIRVIDRLFDILNSKNRFEKEFKSVLRCENEQFWRPFLMQTTVYLSNLKLFGLPLHQTMRKTAVIGFLATINSVIALFDEFVSGKVLAYLATYRFSQDHIELLFNVVRSRGRWNNNPTAEQFRTAYRQLLMKHDIKPKNTGNVVSQEETVLLPAVGLVEKHEASVTTAEILKRFSLGPSDSSTDHEYALTPDRIHVSEFSANIVTYMAGYVSRKLCKTITCVGCKLSLISSSKVVENCKLIQRKDAGGLLYPSQSVVNVCTITERCIRF